MVRRQKHRRTVTTATALAVLFSSAALSVTAAGPAAAADTSKVLSLKSAGDVLVDGVHQRVYISDPTAGRIVVTDYAATVVATLTGLSGVNGLELSADSGLVYAAVTGGSRIIAVDTQTYAQSASYALGGLDGVSTLAQAGGKLWFGYKEEHTGGIGSLDLSGPEPVVQLSQQSSQTYNGTIAPEFGSDPAAPGVLAVGVRESDVVGIYDVSDSGLTLRVSKSVAGNLRELDITPDGKEVITASGAPYVHPAFSTADLSPVVTYQSSDYPNAVDVAPGGEVAGGTFSWYGPDVHIFSHGDPNTVRTFEFPNTGSSSGGDTLAPGALAWAPDGSRIFAVSENSQGVFSLRVLGDPAKSLPAITVSAPSSAARAKALTVTGRITASVAVPAGTPLTVTRTDLESPKGKELPAVVTKAGGAFSFSDTPPAGGNVTYKVSYAGDATHTPASGSDTVAVSRSAVTLTLNNNKKVFSYGKPVAFTAALGKTYKNRTVKIYADRAGDGKGKYLIKSGTVNSAGKLSGTLNMFRDSSVYAVYDGDARTAAKTVTVWAGGQAKVGTSISRHYKTGKIGSTTYSYVHKTSQPYFNTTMNPYPGRKQRLDIQMYYQGAWRSGGSEYFKLDSAGRSVVNLGKPGSSSVGYKFRFRSAYVKGAGYSGDGVNSTVYGSWKYMYVTN
ncbi:Ig-like domain repeat protein [Streptomyces sp. NPDC051064]|uniref:Ig-like domain repeat protein n=1 Tax=Streptomyces sp. NPDC051064 TaxID=3365641 RepID=UPI003798AEA8